MSADNLLISPINQKYVEANKEKVSNQQPQVDLTQKPDTVSFSGKKVARNTGIGTLFGGILLGFLKNKKVKDIDLNDQLSTDIAPPPINSKRIVDKAKLMYIKKLKIERGKSASEFWSKILDIVKKISNGEELLSEEIKLAKTFNLDTPLMRYIYLNDKKDADLLIEALKNLEKEQAYNPDKVNSTLISAKTKIVFNQHFVMMPEQIRGYARGKIDAANSIDLYGDKMKSAVLDALKHEPRYNIDEKGFIKGCEHLFYNGVQERFERDGSDTLKHLSSLLFNAEDTSNLAEKYVENTLAQVNDKIKSGIKSEIIKKETLKSVGVGAAIAGSIALIGSLIYKAVKNKKAEQSK